MYTILVKALRNNAVKSGRMMTEKKGFYTPMAGERIARVKEQKTTAKRIELSRRSWLEA